MMEEKNNAMERKASVLPVGGMPKFDVWFSDLGSELSLKEHMDGGKYQAVRMMRRNREVGADTLTAAVRADLKIVSMAERKRADGRPYSPSSLHREVELEVEMVSRAGREITNHFDDGQGLSAFRTGTRFTVVYWPSDQMARVSRSSAVLYAEPAAEEAEEAPEDGEA